MMPMLETTRDDWFESCFSKSRSENTRNAAIATAKRWDAFLLEKHPNKDERQIINELKRLEGKPELYLFLNSFVQYVIKTQVSARTVKQYFMYLKSWLRANGIRIHNDDVKQFIRFPKHMRELRRPLTYQIIQLLLDNSTKIMQALILVLVSSGMRISEALQLRVTDIDFTKNPVEINIRASTTKTLEERTAFISSEAAHVLKIITEGKDKMDSVFVAKYGRKSLMNIEVRFSRLRKMCGLDLKYANGKNHHVNIHSLRAFFHTQATKALGGDVAHALIGHHKYLDQYFRLTQEERIEQYRQLEPLVIINNEARLKNEIEKKEIQISKQTELENTVLELKAQVLRLLNKK